MCAHLRRNPSQSATCLLNYWRKSLRPPKSASAPSESKSIVSALHDGKQRHLLRVHRQLHCTRNRTSLPRRRPGIVLTRSVCVWNEMLKMRRAYGPAWHRGQRRSASVRYPARRRRQLLPVRVRRPMPRRPAELANATHGVHLHRSANVDSSLPVLDGRCRLWTRDDFESRRDVVHKSPPTASASPASSPTTASTVACTAVRFMSNGL